MYPVSVAHVAESEPYALPEVQYIARVSGVGSAPYRSCICELTTIVELHVHAFGDNTLEEFVQDVLFWQL